ncbi:hypothetical protein Rhe02_29870 [Rhizocola hellebori]|uniref:Uncharacterized protein n=1 Tax=Rhizocola hellebori TaxID=1392758 RepID=A0A8J3Q6V3_9ACTN|nr:hypothetical protein [Rhizocola hellebori]GIH04920.1 hypothetical protein Rhe02_29870 [Rhizocola hellebori]
MKISRIVAATAVALALVLGAAGPSYAAGSETLVMQIKTKSGKMLANETAAMPADYAGPQTITCYVDDVTPPFRIFYNVAYRSIIGCDAPVVAAHYGEGLVRRNGPEEYKTMGDLAGPLTTWTPFNPVVGPCIEDWWIAAFVIRVDFTPHESLSKFFFPPEAYITCL